MGGNPPGLATIPTMRTVTGGPSARVMKLIPAWGSPAHAASHRREGRHELAIERRTAAESQRDHVPDVEMQTVSGVEVQNRVGLHASGPPPAPAEPSNGRSWSRSDGQTTLTAFMSFEVKTLTISGATHKRKDRPSRRIPDFGQRSHGVEIHLLSDEVAALEHVDVAGRVRGEKPLVGRVRSARADRDRDGAPTRHAHQQHEPEPATNVGPELSGESAPSWQQRPSDSAPNSPCIDLTRRQPACLLDQRRGDISSGHPRRRPSPRRTHIHAPIVLSTALFPAWCGPPPRVRPHPLACTDKIRRTLRRCPSPSWQKPNRSRRLRCAREAVDDADQGAGTREQTGWHGRQIDSVRDALNVDQPWSSSVGGSGASPPLCASLDKTSRASCTSKRRSRTRSAPRWRCGRPHCRSSTALGSGCKCELSRATGRSAACVERTDGSLSTTPCASSPPDSASRCRRPPRRTPSIAPRRAPARHRHDGTSMRRGPPAGRWRRGSIVRRWHLRPRSSADRRRRPALAYEDGTLRP